MCLLEDAASATSPLTADEPQLRARARRRAWFCPGAGWALLGRPRWAKATFFFYLCFLAALAWFIVACHRPAAWLSLATFIVSIVAWSSEIAATKRAALRSGPPGWLARRFWPATVLVWLASLAIPALLVNEFGRMMVRGTGMAPTLDDGERVLFRRRIDSGDLRPGAVVLFKLPPQTRVGEPGLLLVGRLLALPGDTISLRKGKYVVNGETTDYLAEKNLVGAAIDVPRWPQTLKVRDGRYFLMQDSPQPGLDSRQFSWIYERDLVSARLIHVSRGRFFQPVE